MRNNPLVWICHFVVIGELTMYSCTCLEYSTYVLLCTLLLLCALVFQCCWVLPAIVGPTHAKQNGLIHPFVTLRFHRGFGPSKTCYWACLHSSCHDSSLYLTLSEILYFHLAIIFLVQKLLKIK